jgi:hypothetical protein
MPSEPVDRGIGVARTTGHGLPQVEDAPTISEGRRLEKFGPTKASPVSHSTRHGLSSKTILFLCTIPRRCCARGYRPIWKS